MKKIEVASFGDPQVMAVVEADLPVPARGEVLLEVWAVGVNPVETYIRAGIYPVLPKLPYTPGGNAAGTILACGPDTAPWQPGDRVYTVASLSGTYAQQCLCRKDQIFSLDNRLSYAQGAALGVPAATAWRALYLRADAKAGERVLIHGASGSVGQAAIQLAVASGLKVYGTAGSPEGLELIRELGATAFDHGREGYLAELAGGCGNEGFDLILEMLANKNLAADLALLGAGGRVIIIGSRGPIEIDPRATMGKETEIRGLSLFNSSPEETIKTHKGLSEAIAKNVLSPRISCQLPLEQAPLAHQKVLESANCGKIVLLPKE